ncbi:MAG: UUP1 family membrane protein [Deltaproteobacteria bacterium]|nr:UUP1 family membrane protein [Deltaproteobacteria bacterium]MBW2394177.1 UUP1 family membrane protein [Deltaproteobacteria bacterium]
MSRSVLVTGFLFLAAGLGLFAAKVWVYDIPLVPADTPGPWQVELRIHVRGDGKKGSVRALLPAGSQEQLVFDERSSSDRLSFSIREHGGNRVGVWTGWLEDIHEVVYQFRIQSGELVVEIPQQTDPSQPTRALRKRYTQPTSELPSTSADVKEVLEELDLPSPDDLLGRVRKIFAFVVHEIDAVNGAGSDALLTLARREGSDEGKERLLITLLRGAGIPARVVRGLELRDGAAPEPRLWAEANLRGVWVPLSAVQDFFARRPGGFVELGRGEQPLVEATGVRAVGHRYLALREPLRPDEIASLLAPDNPILARLSLYRLPVDSQAALRVLLLLPLGALTVALFRNLIGIPTYGTFMPVLIALSLREFSLTLGLALVGVVTALAVVARSGLERLRLLMVPRLSILLCIVVLFVTSMALAAESSMLPDFFAGVVFPIVILTMLVERIYITAAEEGLQEALARGLWSVGVAAVVHPLLRSPNASYLMFSFPELVVAIMGLLVWIGGYTGYRLADLVRFRGLARPPLGEGPG